MLFKHEVMSWNDVFECKMIRRSGKLVRLHICYCIVGDKSKGSAVDVGGDDLLEKTAFFDFESVMLKLPVKKKLVQYSARAP